MSLGLSHNQRWNPSLNVEFPAWLSSAEQKANPLRRIAGGIFQGARVVESTPRTSKKDTTSVRQQGARRGNPCLNVKPSARMPAVNQKTSSSQCAGGSYSKVGDLSS